MAANQWIPSNKDWYKFDSNGKMYTSTWLAQDASGAEWYYVDAEGEMVRNTIIDGYQIDADGIWRS